MSKANELHQSSAAEVFAPWVEWRQETCRGGRQLITVVNRLAGHAVYVDPADLDDALRNDLTANDTIRELREGGFLADSRWAHGSDEANGCNTKQPGAGLVWRGADSFVRRCHERGLDHLFRRGWVVAQIVVAVCGAVAVASIFSGRIQLHAEPGQIPAIIGLGLIAVAIHELGHALVTVHYGRNVRAAGLRLHLGSPAFYVESLDALLLSRRHRIIQAAAGPWAEWLVTSCAAFTLLALQPASTPALILHRFVIVNTITIASNLLPFVGLDGALLLADFVREPDLSFRARAAAIARPQARPVDRWLVAYAAADTVVAVALLAIAMFFWWQLFGGLVSALWTLGPVGVATVVVAVCALGYQLARMIAMALSRFGSTMPRRRSKLAFRIERRWRVRAIKAFRVIPEIAELDGKALGILAGRLERVCAHRTTTPAAGDHLYVLRTPWRSPHRSATMSRGTVAQFDGTTGHAYTNVDVIVLAKTWRQFLTPLSIPGAP